MRPHVLVRVLTTMETIMRRLILAAAFTAFAPLAVAQTYAPGTGMMTAPTARAGMPATGGTTTSSMPAHSASGGSENCGTPDEPKACPPMPRRAMDRYPANK
jgi:hypothetical protein